MNGPPDFVLFLGRFHPVVVHLPIGLMVLLALLEVLALRKRFEKAAGCTGYILAFAALSAAVTTACGWMLSLGGGYEDRLLQWHKWTGIGTAAACGLTTLLFALNHKKLYRLCLFTTVGILAVASHLGGSLTHGRDYLVRYAPGPIRTWLGRGPLAAALDTAAGDFMQQEVFAHVIQPVVETYCFGCHGPEKSKAGLRLDTLEAILKGGKRGPAVTPGNPAKSLMLQFMRLPLAADEHMPPEGKPQPHEDDLVLLDWWIGLGAPGNRKLSEMGPPENIQAILRARIGALSSLPAAAAPLPPDEALRLAEQITDELDIAVGALAQGEPWLQCNASIRGAHFGDDQLGRLAPLAANLRWLDLAGTGVTDAGLAPVSTMRHLTRLHLERTRITDVGLTNLTGLTELQYLNLHSTAITAAGLDSLVGLPNLRQLYLWQTQVTTDAAEAFADARGDKKQIERWQAEIEQLRAKIEGRRVRVDLGTATPAIPVPDSGPVNTRCPVSGRPVDPSKRIIYDRHVIAFCCDDCKAKFTEDPTPFLTKLSLKPGQAESPGESKP